MSTPAWPGARCPGRRRAADPARAQARWAHRARSSSARNRHDPSRRPMSTAVLRAPCSTNGRQAVPPRPRPRLPV